MKKPEKTDQPPVPRKPQNEAAICEAIAARTVLSITYDDGKGPRRLAPLVLFFTAKDKVCVLGTQLAPHPLGDDTRQFEVGRIMALAATGDTFTPPHDFNTRGSLYDHGVLCSVDRS